MTAAAHPFIGRTFTTEERERLRLPVILEVATAKDFPVELMDPDAGMRGHAGIVRYDLVSFLTGGLLRFRYERQDEKLHETREALREVLLQYLRLLKKDYHPNTLRDACLSEPVQTAQRLLNLPQFTGDEP